MTTEELIAGLRRLADNRLKKAQMYASPEYLHFVERYRLEAGLMNEAAERLAVLTTAPEGYTVEVGGQKFTQAQWEAVQQHTCGHGEAIEILTEAIRLTVEYVGNDMLPALDGWSWFDALKRYRPEVARRFVDEPVSLAEAPETEAVASRDAAGFQTPYKDAWDIDAPERLGLEFDTLWASPPCQTFSVAGKGAGRKALDEVLEAVRNESWKDVASLKQVAESSGDDRTALVLVPLAYVWRYKPTYVSLEQVPTVLPVWEAYAGKMREQGYSVWAGYLHSEQYGVPQTRKRAFLIARKDGVEAAPPEPTHSKYYPRTPEKLDEGTEKWVSMEEGLGWGTPDRPYWTVSSGHSDASMVGGSGARKSLKEHGERPTWVVTGGATTEMFTPRSPKVPAPPITGAGNTYYGSGERFTRDPQGKKSKNPESVQVTEQEGATLQTYPANFPFQGSKSKRRLQIGNAVPPKVAEAVLKTFL